MSLSDEGDFRLRLLLRSVYLKGHQDGNLKTSDMSWEDKIVQEIKELVLEKLPKRILIINNSEHTIHSIYKIEGRNQAIAEMKKNIEEG